MVDNKYVSMQVVTFLFVAPVSELLGQARQDDCDLLLIPP